MSGNIMLMHDDTLYDRYFAEDLKKSIKNSGTEDFSQARKLWNKLGLKITVSEEEMINTVIEILSKHLTKGLLQLTVEEITGNKELRDAISEKKSKIIIMRLSRDLPPFKIYAEYIVKSGSVELKKFRFDIKVESNVEIENINVTIEDNNVKSLSFGSFKTYVTLSLLKGEQAIKIVSIEKSLNLPVVHFGNQWENRLIEPVQKEPLMEAELILPKRKIEITAGENKFGRSDFESDLSVEELGYISKKNEGLYHFMIRKQDGIFSIQDDYSKNGTKLNDREIRGRGRRELKNNDKITLAGIYKFIITFKISGA